MICYKYDNDAEMTVVFFLFNFRPIPKAKRNISFGFYHLPTCTAIFLKIRISTVKFN